MTPADAIREAREGDLRPVYLLSGEETYQQSRVLEAIRAAALAQDTAGLNDDHFTAGDVDLARVLETARTLPMMAQRRLVVVRSVERWEKPRGGAKKKRSAADELEQLAEYVAAPSPETTLVLVAHKLDKRRRLVTASKKAGGLVECDPLSRDALPGFIERAARDRGCRLAPGVSDLLAELTGPELGKVADALERVCLYAGTDREVTEDDVAECVVQVRPATIWELTGAVGRRDAGAALTALAKVYDPQDRGLRLLPVLAWSTRQLIKFESATREGLSAPEAAKRAGAPPFKARELAQQVRRLTASDLQFWLETLADVDLALKGGSRRPPLAILEHAVLSMCTRGRRRDASRASRPRT